MEPISAPDGGDYDLRQYVSEEQAQVAATPTHARAGEGATASMPPPVPVANVQPRRSPPRIPQRAESVRAESVAAAGRREVPFWFTLAACAVVGAAMFMTGRSSRDVAEAATSEVAAASEGAAVAPAPNVGPLPSPADIPLPADTTVTAPSATPEASGARPSGAARKPAATSRASRSKRGVSR